MQNSDRGEKAVSREEVMMRQSIIDLLREVPPGEGITAKQLRERIRPLAAYKGFKKCNFNDLFHATFDQMCVRKEAYRRRSDGGVGLRGSMKAPTTHRKRRKGKNGPPRRTLAAT